ncbi:lipocalin family protein [Ferruginibacter sp.]
MKQIRPIILALLLSLPVIIFAQTASLKTKFVGKWLLVKHLYTENKKTEDLLTSNETYVYTFKTDGTYEVSYTSKKDASTTVYYGKWAIVSTGKKLKLYDNHIQTDAKVLVNDKLYPIIKISNTEFVTKELLFGMDLLGTSYYKKQ